MQHVEDCSAAVLVLPWRGTVFRPVGITPTARPQCPLFGDQAGQSINHGPDRVSIRWNDLPPLRYCRVTPRTNVWAANWQSRLSAVEVDRAWGNAAAMIKLRVKGCQGNRGQSGRSERTVVCEHITRTRATKKEGGATRSLDSRRVVNGHSHVGKQGSWCEGESESLTATTASSSTARHGFAKLLS